MKSIYYALGAKLKKYTANWKDLKISTLLFYEYDGINYSIYRNRDRFIIKEDNDYIFYNSVASLRDYYKELYKYKLRIPVQKYSDKVSYAYPGALFMISYIDQDVG